MANNRKSGKARSRCGICGKTTKLKKTECCGQWICDDWNPGGLPSCATNSCSRNHARLTLCGYHFTNKHPGDVDSCLLCKKAFEEEIYIYLKTNEYNIRVPGKQSKKKQPVKRPVKQPVLSLKAGSSGETDTCSICNGKINLVDDSYTIKGEDYYCVACMPLF
jgi:hypothetical protein